MDEKKFNNAVNALLDAMTEARDGGDANDYATAIMALASAREKLACDDDQEEEDFDPEELIDRLFGGKEPARIFVERK